MLTMENNVSVLFICAYLPCDNRSNTEVNPVFADCMNSIQCLIELHDANAILLAGDLNTDMARDNAQSRQLNEFCEQLGLQMAWESSSAQQGPTYEDSQGNTSRIDHFICSSNLFNVISSVCSVDDVSNSSFHKPVLLSLELDTIVHNVHVNVSDYVNNNVDWNAFTSESLDNYRMNLDDRLQNISAFSDTFVCTLDGCKDINHTKAINLLCNKLTDCCINAARECLSVKKGRRKHVPYWKELAEPFRQRALLWHNIWTESGRPREGLIADIRKTTRSEYHSQIRKLESNSDLLRKKRMAECVSDSNTRDLWREVKKMKPSNQLVSNVIDGCTDDVEIASCLRNKYCKLYNSVPTDDKEIIDIEQQIQRNCLYNESHVITVNHVVKAVKLLNAGKSDGCRGLSSDHVLHGSHRLFVMLALLFNTMLVHGFTPDCLLESVIISIPKDAKGVLSDSNNYRGISLCSCFCKILDLIIIDVCSEKLQTSDMQFAFKKAHSTVLCTSVVKDTVAHYMSKGTDVYCCLLDASKAFDKIHFGKLFTLLLKRNIPSPFVRILLDMYRRQEVRVKWKSTFSSSFSVVNGVRQGGVLSPLLFNIYLDVLLEKLKCTGVGCYAGTQYVGVVAYADDVTLLCPSRKGLQQMLNICERFGIEYHITYNPTKTECILFSKRQNVCSFNLKLNNVQLSWRFNRVRHLGMFLTYDLSDDYDVRRKRGDFIYSVNNLMANFGCLSSSTINVLFRSYCTSFYGSQTWSIRTGAVNMLSTMYNKCIRRIWRLPYMSHKCVIFSLSGHEPLHDVLMARFAKMYRCMCNVNNRIVNFIAKRASYDCTSFIGANLIYMSHYVPKNNLVNVDQLNELIACRDGLMDLEGYPTEFINQLIEELSSS